MKPPRSRYKAIPLRGLVASSLGTRPTMDDDLPVIGKDPKRIIPGYWMTAGGNMVVESPILLLQFVGTSTIDDSGGH